MKTKKISLQNMKGALSRDEMKKISAGSGGYCVYTSCGVYTPPCCGYNVQCILHSADAISGHCTGVA